MWGRWSYVLASGERGWKEGYVISRKEKKVLEEPPPPSPSSSFSRKTTAHTISTNNLAHFAKKYVHQSIGTPIPQSSSKNFNIMQLCFTQSNLAFFLFSHIPACPYFTFHLLFVACARKLRFPATEIACLVEKFFCSSSPVTSGGLCTYTLLSSFHHMEEGRKVCQSCHTFLFFFFLLLLLLRVCVGVEGCMVVLSQRNYPISPQRTASIISKTDTTDSVYLCVQCMGEESEMFL